MRIYENDKTGADSQPKEEIFTIICNKCKKVIKVENNIVKEGLFSAAYKFGYFSNKDGETHSFDLCEECYDKMIGDFKIPPEITEANELV
ncbi:MAG: hypothetical protein LBV33_05505 [Lachnospiraceae bacterium]|jgi:ribosomal-protein-alanine N-acetyltransferase|nr:hypothetical protein [Lachnospiraceae bacterium]